MAGEKDGVIGETEAGALGEPGRVIAAIAGHEVHRRRSHGRDRHPFAPYGLGE
jgi:hypothetical protein